MRPHEDEEYQQKFHTPLPVYFFEEGELIAQMSATELPYSTSIVLFCYICGSDWGRIVVAERPWRVEYSCCKQHRKEAYHSSENAMQLETIRRNTEPTFDNAIFGLRYPNMPKEILVRDFLYLCSNYPEICRT